MTTAAVRRRRDSLRPRNYLEPTEVVAAGDPLAFADVALDADALFSCEVVFADPSKARGSLSVVDNFADTETFTLDADVYTFVEELTGAGDVLIGETEQGTLDNLIAAVNGGDGEGEVYGEGTTAHATAQALERSGSTVTFEAIDASTDGNSIAIATDGANAEVSGATLEGATDSRGVLAVLGDDTLGMLAGVNAEGDLVVRYGDGGAEPLTNGARAVIPAALVPKTADRHRLSWAINFAEPQGLIVWIDGRIMARADMEGTLAAWAGEVDGGYIDVPGTPPVEAGLTTAFDGVVSGPLEYFSLRAEPFGAPI